MADEKESAAARAMEKAEAALESTVDKAKSAMDKAAQKVSDLVPDAIEERALAMRNQMSGVFSEFITFINRGNILDLAVGTLIGANFSAIVGSTVADLLSPLIALVSGSGAALTNRMRVLRPGKSGKTVYETLEAATADGAVVLSYGRWLQTILNFFSVAPVLFLVVKAFTASQAAMAKKEAQIAAAAPTTKACPGCLEEVKLAAKRCKFCGGDC